MNSFCFRIFLLRSIDSRRYHTFRPSSFVPALHACASSATFEVAAFPQRGQWGLFVADQASDLKIGYDASFVIESRPSGPACFCLPVADRHLDIRHPKHTFLFTRFPFPYARMPISPPPYLPHRAFPYSNAVPAPILPIGWCSCASLARARPEETIGEPASSEPNPVLFLELDASDLGANSLATLD